MLHDHCGDFLIYEDLPQYFRVALNYARGTGVGSEFACPSAESL